MTLNEMKCIKTNYKADNIVRGGKEVEWGDRAEKIMDPIITMYEGLQALITDGSKLNMTFSGKRLPTSRPSRWKC